MSEVADPLVRPLKIRSKTVRTRVCFGPVETGLTLSRNRFELAEFYRRRAQSGIGIVITDSRAVTWRGRKQLGLRDFLSQWNRFHDMIVTGAIHNANSIALLPITHYGRDSRHRFAQGPSRSYSPISGRYVQPMSARQIERSVKAFARAASYAIRTGYDGVMVDGSRGHLINTFFVPGTNRREDEWGGGLFSRIRYPVHVVKAVRKAIGGDAILAYRISALDLMASGATWNETAVLTSQLQEAGVDLFITDIGWDESTVPSSGSSVPDFAWADITRRFSTLTTRPVMMGLQASDPEQASSLVGGGTVQLVAMTTNLVTDWEFLRKLTEGRPQDIRPWIPGDGRIFSPNGSFGCLVNPNPLQAHLTPIVRKKAVAIIGSGPAGLACALTLSVRGHAPVVFEERDVIGGSMVMGAMVPGKERLARLIDWYQKQLARRGVPIQVGMRADLSMLSGEGFSDVVIATGTTPRRPDISGIDSPHVLTYEELLLDKEPTGHNVAILGTGNVAHEIARYLVRSPKSAEMTLLEWQKTWGVADPAMYRGGVRGVIPEPAEPFRAVTMVGSRQVDPSWMDDWGRGHVDAMVLKIAGVMEVHDSNIEKVDNFAVRISFGDQHRDGQAIRANHVIICAGSLPNTELVKPLKNSGFRVHVIGSAAIPGVSIQRAIQGAIQTADSI